MRDPTGPNTGLAKLADHFSNRSVPKAGPERSQAHKGAEEAAVQKGHLRGSACSSFPFFLFSTIPSITILKSLWYSHHYEKQTSYRSFTAVTDQRTYSYKRDICKAVFPSIMRAFINVLKRNSIPICSSGFQVGISLWLFFFKRESSSISCTRGMR